MSEEKAGLEGATILLNALQEEGVDVIFGYPGGVLLPLYNALIDSSIRHILTRHEQGAAGPWSAKVRCDLVSRGPG